MAEPALLEGTVERVTFHNPENGFSVVKLKARGRRVPVAVVGTLPAVQPGERLLVTGQWRTDRVHGAQFCPETAEVRPPTAADDIVRYLGSGLVREIGPVLARRIVGQFGEQTLEVLDAQPERVREVPGIGPRRATSLAAAWADHRALREVSAFLSRHKIDPRIAPRLVQAYGADAPRALATNPYRMVGQVPGFGCPPADRLGQAIAIRPTAPARLQAAVQAVLIRASEQGHTRQPQADLVAAAAALTGVDPPLIEDAVRQLTAGAVIASRTPRPRPVAPLDSLPLFAAAAAPTSPLPDHSLREPPRSPRSAVGAGELQGEGVARGGGAGLPAADRSVAGTKRLRLYEPPPSQPGQSDDLSLGLARPV